MDLRMCSHGVPYESGTCEHCQELTALRATLAEVEQERDAMRADEQLVANAVIEINHRAGSAEQDRDRLAAEVERLKKYACFSESHAIQDLEAQLTTAQQSAQVEWLDGEPPFPWCDEWFIAVTAYGDKVVLTALPKEHTYDYKTADNTYFKADKIAKWAQFPDSEYIPYSQQSAQEQYRKGMEDLFLVVQTEVRKLRQEIQPPYSSPRFQQMLDAIRAELSKEEGK